MANIITAGNSTNGGTAITTDTSGTLNIVTGSGSGSNAITIDASQVVTIPGNLTVSGTLSASGGVSGGIRSGTAVASTSGTSIDFTGIPTGVKRVTVIFNGVSTSGTSNYLIQIGSGSITSAGYVGYFGAAQFTAGFGINSASASNVHYGNMVITLISGNTYISSLAVGNTAGGSTQTGGGSSPALSGALDRVRITTVNGTDTFDAGSINIFYE